MVSDSEQKQQEQKRLDTQVPMGSSGPGPSGTPGSGIGEASSFEDSLERLQGVLKGLESGQLSLEDSLKFFEDGVRLIRSCQESLRSAEMRVEQLLRQRVDGSPEFQTVTPPGSSGAGSTGYGPQGPRG